MSISRRGFLAGVGGALFRPVFAGEQPPTKEQLPKSKETEKSREERERQEKDTVLVLGALKKYWGEKYEEKASEYFGDEKNNIFSGKGKLVFVEDKKYRDEVKRAMMEGDKFGQNMSAPMDYTEIMQVDFIATPGKNLMKKSRADVPSVLYYVTKDSVLSDIEKQGKIGPGGPTPVQHADSYLAVADLVNKCAESVIKARMSADPAAQKNGVSFEGKNIKNVNDLLKLLRKTDLSELQGMQRKGGRQMSDRNELESILDTYLAPKDKIYRVLDKVFQFAGILDSESRGLASDEMDPRIRQSIAVMLLNYEPGNRKKSVEKIAMLMARGGTVNRKVYESSGG